MEKRLKARRIGDVMASKTKSVGNGNNQGRSANDRTDLVPLALADKKRASVPQSGGKSKDKIAAEYRPDLAYMTLIARFPLRPIRTDAELDVAAGVIDELTDRDDLSSSEADYLDVLGDLVERYENEHVEMPYVSDAAMLSSLMEEKGVRQADVIRATGISKTVLSLVLNGKRELTRQHIGILSKYFQVNPAAFLGPA
jgi:HTH-type transcriptional regulator / antitoxin HigA